MLKNKEQTVILIEGTDLKHLQALAEDAVTDINSMDGNHKAMIFVGEDLWWEKEDEVTVEPVKSYEDFVATKQQVPNSEMAHYSEYPEEYDKTPRHYFIYDGSYWIQEDTDGKFYTMLGRIEYWNEDIRELEDTLYDAYSEERK